MKYTGIEIVIEIEGGVLQAIHSNAPGINVVLLDWDNDPEATPVDTAEYPHSIFAE
jgi:hypothetical protein